MNFAQLIIAFITSYIVVNQTIINVYININTNTHQYPLRMIGQSPGFVIEEAIGHLFDQFFESWVTTPKALSYLGPNIRYVPGNKIHQSLGNPFDFVFHFQNLYNKQDIYFMLDSKAEKKNQNIRATRNQSNNKNNANAYVLYIKYKFTDENQLNSIVIEDLKVTTMRNAYDTKLLRDSKAIIDISNPLNENLKIGRITKKHKNIDIIITRKLMTMNEVSKFLSNSNAVNESKKRVMLKKFIEENFNKRGEYLYPKDGDSKCSFHEEYDKGLLKFLAEHGIKKIMSIHSSHAPSLGFSEEEQKWYRWSHRAIYGFEVGDKIKKGTCGYEEIKKQGLLNIKTLEQAKQVAKIFANDVS